MHFIEASNTSEENLIKLMYYLFPRKNKYTFCIAEKQNSISDYIRWPALHKRFTGACSWPVCVHIYAYTYKENKQPNKINPAKPHNKIEMLLLCL